MQQTHPSNLLEPHPPGHGGITRPTTNHHHRDSKTRPQPTYRQTCTQPARPVTFPDAPITSGWRGQHPRVPPVRLRPRRSPDADQAPPRGHRPQLRLPAHTAGVRAPSCTTSSHGTASLSTRWPRERYDPPAAVTRPQAPRRAPRTHTDELAPEADIGCNGFLLDLVFDRGAHRIDP
jgi:hypothetical protein